MKLVPLLLSEAEVEMLLEAVCFAQVEEKNDRDRWIEMRSKLIAAKVSMMTAESWVKMQEAQDIIDKLSRRL